MNRQELQRVLIQHCVWVKSLGTEGASADLSDANLKGANLYETNLQRADLRGANLCWASLQRANLRWADLRWADLRGASLSGANLRGASLSGADLRGADLRGADLRWADLHGANLRDANLHGANLRWANLHGANMKGANLKGADLRCAVGIPVAVDSDDRLRQVAAVATASQDGLYMGSWHTCQTTHCIAGWAIHQAGETGRILEELHGPELAGRMLLGHEAATHFHDTNEQARAWLLSVLNS